MAPEQPKPLNYLRGKHLNIQPNDYVVFKDEQEGTQIGKVVTKDDGNVKIQRTYQPVYLPQKVQCSYSFAPNEILMTSATKGRKCIKELDIEKIIEVEEDCEDCYACPKICWNRTYNPLNGEISAQSRRIEVCGWVERRTSEFKIPDFNI